MKSARLVSLLVVIVCLCARTFSQATPDVEQGMKPYGSYHGGNLDRVNLTNGNLFFHADLFSYSQRGGELGYSIALEYNGKNFSTYQPPCPPGDKCPFREYILFGPNPLRTQNLSNGNTMTIGFEGFAGTGTGFIDTGLSFDSNEIYVKPLSAITIDGAVHQLASTNAGMVAVDGSGYAAASQTSLIAVDRNGTASAFASSATDRNGNEASASVDTLGRNIPSAPTAGGPLGTPPASTANLGSCPALNYSFQPANYAYTWNLPTVNGGMLPLILCYTGVYVRMGAGTPGPPIFTVSENFWMLQSVVFPDNTYWAFEYDAADPNNTNTVGFGDLLKVTFPTGGSLTYTWAVSNAACNNRYDRAVLTRTVNANDGTGPHTWTYNYGVPTVTVTDPLGNDTVHTITGLGTELLQGNPSCSLYETETQYYQGSHSGGTLLKTVATDYQYQWNPYDPGFISSSGGATTVTNVFPIRVTTTLPNGLVSKTETDYDTALAYHGPLDGITSNIKTCPPTDPGGNDNSDCHYYFYADQTTYPVTNYTGSYGKPVAVREYDWGQGTSGSLLRKTLTTYQWQVNSAYLSANLLDLPASVQVLDGNGTQVSLTTYGYDEYSVATSGAPQLAAAPWTVRGNQTSVHHWLNGSTTSTTNCPISVSNGYLISYAHYNDTGTVASSTDTCATSPTDPNHTTTHTYSSTYASAYPTQTCNPKGQCVNGVYDFDTGLLTSFSDANSQTSNYSYDNRFRLTQALFPADSSGNRPETDFDYSVLNQVKRSKKQASNSSGTTWIYDYAYFDGLGRTYKTRLVDPEGDDLVDTTYDALGRVSTVSNPHRSSTSATDGITTTAYDALGRATQVTKQDGSVVVNQYEQTASSLTNTDCTTTTDEAGKVRRGCTDGLGRLVEVDEPGSSGGLTSPYVTLYSYDTLGNLLQVNQKGDGSQAARVRNFTYDSLSRLLTANNPESGTISYVYDADGNLLQKTSPAPNVLPPNTGTQTISYCYDVLNRVQGKGYGAQSCPLSTPVVTYTYDASANGIGRLASLTDQAGAGSYTYDPMGRTLTESRTINGITKNMAYAYNLDSSLQQVVYPSGAGISYQFTSAGRLGAALDPGNNINYVTGAGGPGTLVTHFPDGSPMSYTNGWTDSFAGINNTFSYNPRLQPVTMAAVSPGTTGTKATASVTISGSLNSAASSSGSALPNAATNSALTSYIDFNAGYHLVYEAANQHLIDVYCTGNAPAGFTDLTLEAGAPLAASGSQVTFFFDSNNAPHWGYLGTDQHLYLIYRNGSTYLYVDMLSWAGGSPLAASGSALASSFQATNYWQTWSYFGTNQHLYYLNGAGTPSYTDVTAAAGAPAAAAGSAMTFFLDSYNTPHWAYLGTDQNLYLIYLSDTYHYVNMMSWAGGSPVAASGSALASSFQATNYWSTWSYFGTNQHIYYISTTAQPYYTDVTAAAGAPVAAAGSQLSFVLDQGNSPHWTYLGNDQHVYLIYSNSSGYHYVDMLSWAGGSPLSAGSWVTTAFQATGYWWTWAYLGTNQHAYEVYNGPSYTDFMAGTPRMLDDSGTVSLSLGGFTATACFGASTNPACTGQAVNNNPAQVAMALAQALNVSSSPVTATASGATINLTWKVTGPFTTPVSPLSTTHDNPGLFSSPSFTSAATNFGGGSGANSTVFSLNYDFHVGSGDNGNVWAITNNKDTSRNQSFTYDQLNRLISAQNAGTNCSATTANGRSEYWGNSYGYDPWGNLLTKSVTKCSAENLSVTVNSSNQLQGGYTYDIAGNMQHDATANLNYTYDPENRINGAAGYTYIYDDDGNRVEKSNGSSGTLYWYMSPGIVAESDLSGNLKSEYVFFGGSRSARKDLPGGTVEYYFSDHLKTATVITDSGGNIKSESDFYPWGGELQLSANDNNHYKFTGKERDSETGLDYFGARYYSNGLARFITPDWGVQPQPVPYADFELPQTLNLYRYPSNPETFADRDGHQDTSAARQKAVRDAWKQEREMVAKTGEGTRKWTAAEKKELLETGKVSGYIGHHVNSVKGHENLAGEPDNIEFVKGQGENLAKHQGNFRNPTTGKLLSRLSLSLQMISVLVESWGYYRFNQHESETGLRADAMNGVQITNVDKAAQVLDPGTQTKTSDGEVFTLGQDRVWRDMIGNTLYHDDKDGKDHVRRVPL